MDIKYTPLNLDEWDLSNLDAEALCHEMGKVKIESIADWMNTYTPLNKETTGYDCNVQFGKQEGKDEK